MSLRSIFVHKSLTELFKILKNKSPISLADLVTSKSLLKMHVPRFNLDISRNNYVVSSCTLWNSCAPHIFDKPVLTPITFMGKRHELIIPGSNCNSDLTMSVPLFKRRLKLLLLSIQKLGDPNLWSNENFKFWYQSDFHWSFEDFIYLNSDIILSNHVHFETWFSDYHHYLYSGQIFRNHIIVCRYNDKTPLSLYTQYHPLPRLFLCLS